MKRNDPVMGEEKMVALAAYICSKYPYKDELAAARLTKMVYLCDWRSAVEQRHQITPIEWVFHMYGPYTDDVVSAARQRKDLFEVKQGMNFYGNPKTEIQLVGRPDLSVLTDQDRQIADSVVAECAPLTWKKFIEHVYETYPVVTQPRFSPLHLVDLAEESQKETSEG